MFGEGKWKVTVKFGFKMKRPLSGSIPRQPLRAVHLRTIALLIIYPACRKSQELFKKFETEGDVEPSSFANLPSEARCFSRRRMGPPTLKLPTTLKLLRTGRRTGDSDCAKASSDRSKDKLVPLFYSLSLYWGSGFLPL